MGKGLSGYENLFQNFIKIKLWNTCLKYAYYITAAFLYT